MTDVPLYLDSNDDTGVRFGRGSTTCTPRSVYVFWIIVIVPVFVIEHLTDGGLGGHIP